MTIAIHTTGTIKWINHAKGFGIITPDAGGKDLFAHFPVRTAADIRAGLRINQKVSYDIKQSVDGDLATNVTAIK